MQTILIIGSAGFFGSRLNHNYCERVICIYYEYTNGRSIGIVDYYISSWMEGPLTRANNKHWTILSNELDLIG